MKNNALKILIIVLLVSMMVPALALASGQKIFDSADLFSSTEEQTLQETIEAHISAYNSDLAIVTINDSEGKTSEAYADDFFDKHEFGTGDDRSGILFLIDMDNRELYISTTGKMIDILTDDRINELTDLQYSYVSEGDYYTAMLKSIEKAEEYISLGAPAGQYQEARYEPSLSVFEVIISILIAAGIGGLVVLIISKSYKKNYRPVPYDYSNEAKLNLTNSLETLIDKHVTSRYIPPNNNSGSGSGSSSFGRSSTHTSSSGTTHGGGGRKF